MDRRTAQEGVGGAGPAVLGVGFVAQNRVPVRIRWMVFGVTWPLWPALLVMPVVGVLIGVPARRRSARRR
ncbi:DUF1049 domain-containing protein [Streptosporangium sp. NPDC020145]|uniref:DUF1049 domain-containing protein n=1 Tax=Streptosporangium sp. NPDC020145 TaxID=3154694 RepID=UPI003412535D